MISQRVRKIFGRRKQTAVTMTKDAGYSIEKHVFGRFDRFRLRPFRRFVGAWVLLLLLLGFITLWQMTSLFTYYQSIEPVPGGIYSEGILGTLTNVNPIYATSLVDTSLSQLIFAGLFSYNSNNQLVNCLASGYSVDSAGTLYTVTLKPGLTWQDGQPLTAADVVFTIDTIQNPAAQSPLYSSWQGITATAVNPLTVRFKLPNPLASFPYELTLGIIPKHILGGINPADLRSANFNNFNPIGAGPFVWNGIEVSGNTPQNAAEQVALLPFANYALGKPKLNEFIVHAYADRQQLIQAFAASQLNALAGLNTVPQALKQMQGITVHSLILTAGNYVFFKTQGDILSDANLRRALVLAANPKAIMAKLGYQTYPVTEPLLVGQLAYSPKYAQVTNDLTLAKSVLDQDGWISGPEGYRYKNGHQLSFNLVTTNTPENHLVVSILKKQWQALGVNLQPIFESAETYSATLQDHNYDSTLEGISIGVDPDVFVYWDSSQYDPRSTGLNLSEYNNATANSALDQGRTRLNPALRVIKYAPFLAVWQQDNPALGLYQPRFIYITHGTVYGLSDHEINSAPNRFNNVQNWEILRAGVTDKRP